MKGDAISLLRYPGGKQRLLNYIMDYLPSQGSIRGRLVEPFVGGAAIFFALDPEQALLSDINPELITLYNGLRWCPDQVWEAFQSFPSSKEHYYELRGVEVSGLDLAARAARILYLNRTCFKGMWRQNSSGQFNVGYGGQDRRSVISKESLFDVSRRLQKASVRVSDFEDVIEDSTVEDFLYLDPPYSPGAREMTHSHYVFSQFRYDDHKRLAESLKRATRRGVRWAMTTSSHPDILYLFQGHRTIHLPKGTGRKPGVLTDKSEEVLVCNY